MIYNVCLYFSPIIQKQYFDTYGDQEVGTLLLQQSFFLWEFSLDCYMIYSYKNHFVTFWYHFFKKVCFFIVIFVISFLVICRWYLWLLMMLPSQSMLLYSQLLHSSRSLSMKLVVCFFFFLFFWNVCFVSLYIWWFVYMWLNNALSVDLRKYPDLLLVLWFLSGGLQLSVSSLLYLHSLGSGSLPSSSMLYYPLPAFCPTLF